jgi:Fe-S cluster assembly protein SufD
LDEPVVVNVFGAGSEAAVFNHLVLDIGANARATVVLQHQGSTVRAGNAEIIVGEGASLILVSVQDWDDDAVHLAHLHARIGREASYRQALVSIGGDVVRISSSVDFAAPGGEAELLGLYFADAGCSSTTMRRAPAATWTTGARCKDRERTPSGSGMS